MFGGGPRFAVEWLIVGLGNPGEDHARNRHNVGFWVLNDLAKRAGTQPKAEGSTMAIGVGTLAGHRVALVKPRTYMNLSGKALAQAVQWTGCDLAHTIVIYDELDMASGALRVRAGGGAGGHNGMKSIIAAIGADFVRVRIGIGRPVRGGEPTWDPEAVAGWVLSNPAGEEKTRLEETARLAADAVEAILQDGPEAAGNRFNRK
ncbi:MAG: aminoacyl-tRNA hydrolase [Dehalococcoidia bacterium]|nr:aminoacyl-tRNA hydrolase [Dehalococcoidia bacterium]